MLCEIAKIEQAITRGLPSAIVLLFSEVAVFALSRYACIYPVYTCLIRIMKPEHNIYTAPVDAVPGKLRFKPYGLVVSSDKDFRLEQAPSGRKGRHCTLLLISGDSKKTGPPEKTSRRPCYRVMVRLYFRRFLLLAAAPARAAPSRNVIPNTGYATA